MPNRLLAMLTGLLLLAVREGLAFTERSSVNSSTTQPSNWTSTSKPPEASPTPCSETVRNISRPVVALLRVRRKTSCEGQLYVECPVHGEQRLCADSNIFSRWTSELCEDMRCGGFKNFTLGPGGASGLFLTSNMSLEPSVCPSLGIVCFELPDTLGNELAAYKAVTAILILFILVVLLVKYFQPSYKAIHKRFSQKRQSRWIGPTQTQSVSYHRGQGGPHDNTVKRQSYPGLERLTVNSSREPSSNRNSDYDSYGLN